MSDPGKPYRDLSAKAEAGSSSQTPQDDPLVLLDECLASLPERDPRIELLYKIRHLLLQQDTTHQQQQMEYKQLQTVVEKLTAPANRVGTLLDLPGEGMARILVGGSEYYANIDPRLEPGNIYLGAQLLVNEAFVVIQALGYDENGPVQKVREVLDDGRIRLDQEPGRPGLLLQRATKLKDVHLKAGDEVRLEPTLRFVIERLDNQQAKTHLLDEVPSVKWEQIGGQQLAIAAIRRAIEYPLLHAATFERYEFTQPKGFLLYGPPGCGKTLIGQATAASLAELVSQNESTGRDGSDVEKKARSGPAIKGGVFLHVKGPEILNMWVGESERMIRDLIAQARQRRREGLLPFLFIDEAESILGTRRAMRSYNISNTLVPMFCAELDGIESLQDVVVILASNRPDLIDPAVLRPGRIDRKIKVDRPGRQEALDILRIYLKPELPLDQELLTVHHDDRTAACEHLIAQTVDHLFQRTDDTRVLSIRLRNGRREVLYRNDLLSGAIIAGIVRRAKERAIERTIRGQGEVSGGVTEADLCTSISDEYREGEILPPDDSAEEWLKLLDHHPDQVVGVSSFRKGMAWEERPIQNII